jgi:group I intron endonuclease
VITYLGITLNNRKFYVGSAVDFERRQKGHLKSKDNYPFQNALRKDPEGVYWIASEDDGLDTREEEQFYLDFYHGSEWCYNLSSRVSHPDREMCRKGGVTTKELHGEQQSEWGRQGGAATHLKHPELAKSRGGLGGKAVVATNAGFLNPEHSESVNNNRRKNSSRNGALTGKTNGQKSKRPVEVTLNSGEVLVFDCAGAASKSLNIPRSSLVNHLQGRCTQVHGHTARYI